MVRIVHWLISMCNTTHLYVWACGTTHSHVCGGGSWSRIASSFLRCRSIILISFSWVWHDSWFTLQNVSQIYRNSQKLVPDIAEFTKTCPRHSGIQGRTWSRIASSFLRCRSMSFAFTITTICSHTWRSHATRTHQPCDDTHTDSLFSTSLQTSPLRSLPAARSRNWGGEEEGRGGVQGGEVS